MLFNAVSTLGLSRKLQGSLLDLQLAVAKTGEEVASGKHFDVAGALGARTGQAISLRGAYDDGEETLRAIDALDARMGLMDTALTEIHDRANDVLAQASTILGQPTGTASTIGITARGALDSIIGLLNATGGGSYLFAGTEVDTAPMRQAGGDSSGLPAPVDIVRTVISTATGGSAVPQDAAQVTATLAALDDLFAVRDPATTLPITIDPYAFEGAFYLGATAQRPGGAANARLTAQPESGSVIPYGIQANDPEVRQILEGLYMLAAVDVTQMPDAAYEPYMKAATDKLSSGIARLRDATAQLGIQKAGLAETSERHNARLKVLSQQINNLETVDPAETGVRLSQLEQQVEMTSQATARIARMRLTEYI